MCVVTILRYHIGTNLYAEINKQHYLYNMKEIQLSNGGTAIIDDEDFEMVSTHSWCQDKGYAVCTMNRKGTSMHRLILGLSHGDGKVADHINHIKLDNRKSNLRLCTRKNNNQNRVSKPNSTSNYLGVYYTPRIDRWQSNIKSKYIGIYNTEEEAARAYDSAALYYYGEYANLNFNSSIPLSIEDIQNQNKLKRKMNNSGTDPQSAIFAH